MIITSQEIQSQEFHVRFRGFDVEEVEDFLEKLAADFQAVSDENKKLKNRLEIMEKDLATYQNQQRSFQSAIIAAQNVADAMKEKSREEAEAIVAEARDEARLRREAVENEISELRKKVDTLQALKTQARDDLRRQLNSYLSLLDTEPGKNARTTENPISAVNRQAAPQSDNLHGDAFSSATGAEPEPWPEQQVEEDSRLSSTEETADLDDLYVKIDIPDISRASSTTEEVNDFMSGNMTPPSSISGRQEIRISDEAVDSGVPDLDGDMLFDFEDPLEPDELSITSVKKSDEVRSKKGGRFNPDESPL